MKQILFENALRESRAYQILQNDLKVGLSHAYMFVSPDDEAIASFFMMMACSTFCVTNNACTDCADCTKVLHYNHPNVFWINLERGQIKVEDIRELTSSAYIKAYDDKPKLYFILCADQMNFQAQNKLLKTLEEPPEGVTIILGVSNVSAMKDTIQSRCRIVNLDLFDYETVYKEIFALTSNSELSTIAAACSEGELGKAHKIALEPEYTAIYRSALDMLTNMTKSSDIAKYLSAAYIPKNLDDYLSVLSILLRDILVVRFGKEIVLSKHLLTEISALAPQFSEKAIVEIQGFITEARKKIFFHISATTVLESLYFGMLEVKYKWH
ncbi:MAG TPA: hypothetical protein VJZ69_01785 [Clostridia bacterium]|nr:hypothetical protein [Clostridia bacterium]